MFSTCAHATRQRRHERRRALRRQHFTVVYFFLYAGIGIIVCIGVGYMASVLVPARQKDLSGVTIYTRPPGSAAQAR